jgi:hypothetical protein
MRSQAMKTKRRARGPSMVCRWAPGVEAGAPLSKGDIGPSAPGRKTYQANHQRSAMRPPSNGA